MKGLDALEISVLTLYYGSEEALEGQRAFMEKPQPDFRQFRR